jgi:alpha-L-fucosidase 2
VDISGGLPAVVTEMILQSSSEGIALLPALPSEWPDGQIKGVPTRCGVVIDLEWNNGNPDEARLLASRDTKFTITYKGREWSMQMSEGEVSEWRPN